jgi:hypothetical protein
VLFAPVIAVVAARRPRERFGDSVRRALPLYAAVGAWGLLFLGALSRHEFAVHPGPFQWDAIPAAFVHLLQVMLGLEWKAGVGPRLHIAWYAIAVVGLATLAVAWASARRRQSRPATSSHADRSGPHAALVGLLWVAAGTLPVVAMTPTWSAHGYLFPLCGLALLVAAWAARQARWVGPALVAVLALCSQNTRRLDGVATGRNPWAPQSHMSRDALEQDMQPVSRYVAELRRLRPSLPRGSSLFFARVPHFWEAGGGRLVRWAYRDSSLRAYDLSTFSMERARRGSAYFFGLTRDTLREIRPADLRDIAVNTLRRGKSGAAREALMFAAESDPEDWMSRYWLAWIEWSGGDTTAALQHLARLGMRSNQRFEWSGSWAEKTLAAGDSAKTIDLLLKAVRHQPLDYELHRRMAQLAQVRPGYEALGDVEAFAARALARRPPPRRS